MDVLYKTIESLCRNKNVTVTTMCKESGVPRSTLSDFKSGRIKSLSADKLSIAYVAGNIPDAELKSLIAKAEASAPPEPQDITPLKALLETDFQSVYEIMSEEEKQRFWHGLIK